MAPGPLLWGASAVEGIMGKYLNSGITWSDVTYLLVGLQTIHECTVELTVLTGGPVGSHSLVFTVSAWRPTVEAHQTQVVAEFKGDWPDRDHPTFDSCIFNALYQLDRLIGKADGAEIVTA
jgi:hypothetical protein